MMAPTQDHANEFSRIVRRADLALPERYELIVATPDECAAVAQRLGLVAVTALSARLTIKPWRRNGLAVTGRLEADIVQTCVVSLEDFASTVQHDDVAARFAEQDDPVLAQGRDPKPEIVIEPLAEDAPEIMPSGGVDLGELVVEHLAICLDSHPRRRGVEFSDEFADTANAGGGQERKPDSPFAVLESLKRTGDAD